MDFVLPFHWPRAHHVTCNKCFAANNILLMRSCEKMAHRFPELSENDSTSLVDRKNSKNSKKGTKGALNVFQEYLKGRRVDEESLLSSTRRTSWRRNAYVLKRFYAEARKKNGELLHQSFTCRDTL